MIYNTHRGFGKQLIPHDNPEYIFGYDDPRDYLPKEIIKLLDKEL